MEVFRISRDKYAIKSIPTSGVANRWNKAKEEVLYTGSSRSLSTLELAVHFNSIKPSHNYKVMVFSIEDDDHLMEQVFLKNLPTNWRTRSAYPTLQKMGSDWYHRKSSLVLKVPSAIITKEFNYMINKTHADFNKRINFVGTEDYFWDDRLLKMNKKKK